MWMSGVWVLKISDRTTGVTSTGCPEWLTETGQAITVTGQLHDLLLLKLY